MTARLLRRSVIAVLVLLALPPPPAAAVVGTAVGAAGAIVAGVVLARVLAGAWPSAAAVVEAPRAFTWKLAAVTAQSAFEEVVWRWAVLGLAAGAVGAWLACALATVLFALAHLHTVGWPAAAQHLATGALFAGAVVLTGSLVPAVAAHAAYNATLLLGRESELLVTAPAAA